MDVVQALKRHKDARRMMRALDDDEWASENKMAAARRELSRSREVLLAELERTKQWAMEPYNAKPWPEDSKR